MSTHTQHTENFETYFCTLVCYRWFPLFQTTNFYEQVYNWFDHLKTKGCYILGDVIMPNHLHALLYPTSGSLNKLTANGKRFMAYEMVKRLEQGKRYALLKESEQGVRPNERRKGKKHQVLRLSFDARKCFDEKMVEQKLDYLHHNPVQGKWNLVEDHADYQHSSAQFYETGVHGVYEVTHYKEIVVEYEERWVKGSPESSARDSQEVKNCVL